MTHQDFTTALRGPETLVTPVIHVLDAGQALRNLDTVDAAGCPGAFLINHDFSMEEFLPILKEVRAARPDLWLGVNFLDQPGDIAFPILGQLAGDGCQIDAYWADDARIDERVDQQDIAEDIARIRKQSGWTGVYLGGVAFKKQRSVPEEQYARAARLSVPYLDVVTTSGIATGHEADLSKMETFRNAIGDAPLALASGITPENAAEYCGLVNCFLVATGINYPGDFYNIDPARLDALLAITRKQGETV
ncbi:BtpA/SgcQ family protein [uncultured Tateyamaria sp.]|uniref:BtpA/SgcQ family protein n=1 Tax=uncultured Tateyamaria sp. TaxID=455651 RepID=UPI002602AE63|nr:BtpA/SgcQ family protein [uncultured Tateyamaria sp.]